MRVGGGIPHLGVLLVIPLLLVLDGGVHQIVEVPGAGPPLNRSGDDQLRYITAQSLAVAPTPAESVNWR